MLLIVRLCYCVEESLRKNPMSWSTSDTQGWLLSLNIPYHCIPGEKFSGINGERLCSMRKEEFVTLDPQNGSQIFSHFQQLLHSTSMKPFQLVILTRFSVTHLCYFIKLYYITILRYYCYIYAIYTAVTTTTIILLLILRYYCYYIYAILLLLLYYYYITTNTALLLLLHLCYTAVTTILLLYYY